MIDNVNGIDCDLISCLDVMYAVYVSTKGEQPANWGEFSGLMRPAVGEPPNRVCINSLIGR